MFKKIIIAALTASCLTLFLPQHASAQSCSTIAMRFHRTCLSWGTVSPSACAAEAENVFNNCLKYNMQYPIFY